MTTSMSTGLSAVRVFLSRYHPGLKPGDGEKIDWEVGETVRVIAGQDDGRLFMIQSEGRSHAGAPGRYVREGYFLDDPERTLWAKPEDQLWFANANDYQSLCWAELAEMESGK